VTAKSLTVLPLIAASTHTTITAESPRQLENEIEDSCIEKGPEDYRALAADFHERATQAHILELKYALEQLARYCRQLADEMESTTHKRVYS
jgi:hypothetical protein